MQVGIRVYDSISPTPGNFTGGLSIRGMDSQHPLLP